ncbi:MAG: VPLPA-CTERM sorting domain-containing protein [Gammaproteobacteria bacterium]|jgi:hypothetical protein
MRLKYNRNTVLTTLVMLSMLTLAPSSNAALVNYSQNFEALHQADPAALGNDGWRVFANVYNSDKTFYRDYGVLVAPNGGAGFSTITTIQGNQQLKVFSDYSNSDHADGKWIEALVFQQQTISASEVGSIWNFTFDVKQGDQIPESSSNAYLRTFNSALDMTSESIFNTTAFGTSWGTKTLSLEIDNSLVGQLLQFGFSSTASNYTPSGVLYDNISFSSAPAVPIPGAVWLMMSGLIGLVGVARRRKH